MSIRQKGHHGTERAATDVEPVSTRESDIEPGSGRESDILQEETSRDTTDVPIDSSQQQARVDAMIDESRAAQQRELVRRGIDLWNRAEAAYHATLRAAPRMPAKVH